MMIFGKIKEEEFVTIETQVRIGIFEPMYLELDIGGVESVSVYARSERSVITTFKLWDGTFVPSVLTVPFGRIVRVELMVENGCITDTEVTVEEDGLFGVMRF